MRRTKVRPLSWYLVCLCLSATVPLLLLSALTVWRFAESEQSRLSWEMQETNSQLGFAIERDLSAKVASVRSLIMSRNLAVGDLAAFYDKAKDWARMEGQGTRVFLLDPSDKVILDTNVAWTAPIDQFEVAFAQNQPDDTPVISDFLAADTAADAGFFISGRVTRGNAIYRVVVRTPVSRLAAIFGQQGLKPPYYASIIDRNGVILARSSGDGFAGKILPGFNNGSSYGKFRRVVNIQGVPVVGVRRTTAFGWGVTTGVAEAALNAPVRRTLINLAMVAFVMFCLSAGFAFMFARRLASSCSSLAKTARLLGEGIVVVKDPTPVTEFVEIGSALEEASQRLAEQTAAVERGRRELEHTVEVRTKELAKKTDVFEKTLETMDQGLLAIDENGAVSIFNQRARELLKLPPDVLVPGRRFEDVLSYWTEHKLFKGSLKRARERQAEMSLTPQTYELEAEDGCVLELRAVPLASGGSVRTYTDISARKTSERQAAHLARHDFLTGLPNRMLFRERFEQSLAYVTRHGGSLAMLYLDLDLFKEVNDTYGHPVGDAVLREAASRIGGLMRAEDTVARLGGDEFAILQTAGDHPVRSTGLARRLLDEIGRPYVVEDRHITIGVSIGIALSEGNGETVDTVFKRADTALYKAKHEGRNRYAFNLLSHALADEDAAKVA